MATLNVPKRYKVIDYNKPQDKPKDFELHVAQVLANYFGTDVIFQKRERGKTADLNIDGQIWEIKSPLGNSKNTMDNNLKTAKMQSKNIIIDLSRTKIRPERAVSRIRHYVERYSLKIERILVVTKTKKVIDIFK